MQPGLELDVALHCDIPLRRMPPAVGDHQLAVDDQEGGVPAGSAERVAAVLRGDEVSGENAGEVVLGPERIVALEYPLAEPAADQRIGAVEDALDLSQGPHRPAGVPPGLLEHAPLDLEILVGGVCARVA